VIGLVAVTAAGARAAERLAEAWPDAERYDGRPAEALRTAWTECDGIVCFLAVGATVRLLAPLLRDKASDPGVVCVDEAGRFAVPVVGGHGGGANALAQRVADVLGAEPVVTTATDAAGLPGLDTLGWPVEGAVAAVSRALLDGDPVRLEVEPAGTVWPLPALPVGPHGERVLLVTDRAIEPDGDTAVLRPPSLVVGVGSSRGVTAEEVLDLVDAALAGAGLSPASLAHLATVDAKRDEAGIVEAARRRAWRLVCHAADTLAAVAVPHPSEVVRAAVGTPSVSEAAALVGGGDLLVPKTASAMAAVAVARHRPRGRLALVGLGPGARDLLTPRAAAELRRASVVVGLDQYIDQVRDLLRPGTRVLATGLGSEEARARSAVDEARAGHAVALIGSGDAGVYAMASPALQYAADGGADGGEGEIEVVGVPGVTAALAAASLLGAPLGHDHASVSLSDLHTPWEVIVRRVRAAAEGDFVVALYNPRSRGRTHQLPDALALLAEHRAPATPVGLVRDATRPGERVELTTLAEMLDGGAERVDMLTTVVVGNSASRVAGGRFVTPRGYRWA
jgi:cobalt-precorrin 5A hydrolase/precorrin-3B C17-methyltransferase